MISPDDDKIPDNLWKIFPVKGQYIKNILIYSGYETFDSIIKLKDDSELTEAISFVKEMSEIMDENERGRTLESLQIIRINLELYLVLGGGGGGALP